MSESTGGKLRDELLNQELFLSLAEVRWRLDYNHHRIHSALNYQTPVADAAGCVLPASATPQPPEHSRVTSPRFSHSTWYKLWGGQVDVPSVRATIYVKSDRAMISASNWSDKQANFKFKIDWGAIGLDPTKIQFRTPPMEGMQGERVFGVNDVITIQAHQGLQIYLEAKP